MQTTWITEIKQAPSLLTYIHIFRVPETFLCMLISQCAKIELLPSSETSWDIKDKYTIEDKYKMTKFATIL